MSFQEWLSDYREFDFDGFFAGVTNADVVRSLNKESLGTMDFMTLLSPLAGDHLAGERFSRLESRAHEYC